MDVNSASRRIELVETLGQGGMGAVYLAEVHQGELVQRLALKVLAVDVAGDAEVAARQRDEARLLAQLNHENIVKVVELLLIDGKPAVLMEYVEGVDAAAILSSAPFTPRAALEAVASTAGALHAAYDTVSATTGRPLCAIHRDIKPSNLFVSVNGGLKVLDFGIARADMSREGKTQTAMLIGTFRYMAPEQWLASEVTPKVDVYALGASPTGRRAIRSSASRAGWCRR
jgi:serine/threonine protein kinase